MQNLDAVVLASRRTITSCSRAADVKRATRWIRAATRFNEKYGSPHLYTTCRIHYARGQAAAILPRLPVVVSG